MKFGLFQIPFSPPERSPKQVFNWAVDQGIAAEAAGLPEFWVGQHMTAAWEAIPNPEMVLAVVARETSKLTLAPGAHVVPYYHPASLASQTAWLSHLADGRYIMGAAIGVNPTDTVLHGFGPEDDKLEITLESLDVMEKIWAGGPFRHEGKHWKVEMPAEAIGGGELRDLTPYGGSMRVALGGASPNSTSIIAAGARGYIPLSFGATPELVSNHWDTYLKGARDAGREASVEPGIQRVTMQVFAADTDAEAVRLVKDGPIAKAWREQTIPNELRRAARAGTEPIYSLESSMDDLIRDYMVVGSPETVVEKLNALVEKSGAGWGTTLLYGFDFSEDPAAWNYSLELLAKEVGPKVKAHS